MKARIIVSLKTGVLDPQITRQSENRIVVQLPGVDDPNRIKELIGRTAKMTFRLLDENANLSGTPPPGVDFLVDESSPGARLLVPKVSGAVSFRRPEGLPEA